jgi:hypothetical protein
MTRDEVLTRLRLSRAEFDRRVAALSSDALDEAAPGCPHSPKQIVAHVTAYEQLMVDRLQLGRLGEETSFDRDRVGGQAFNERIWAETAALDAEIVLECSAITFLRLLEEIAITANDELTKLTGVAAAVDPAWLGGRALWEMIGVDGFDHYPMHYAQLEAAAMASR